MPCSLYEVRDENGEGEGGVEEQEENAEEGEGGGSSTLENLKILS